MIKRLIFSIYAVAHKQSATFAISNLNLFSEKCCFENFLVNPEFYLFEFRDRRAYYSEVSPGIGGFQTAVF